MSTKDYIKSAQQAAATAFLHEMVCTQMPLAEWLESINTPWLKEVAQSSSVMFNPVSSQVLGRALTTSFNASALDTQQNMSTSVEDEEVLSFISEQGTVSSHEVHEKFGGGGRIGNTHSRLSRMFKEGKVTRPRRGHYSLNTVEQL